MAEYIEREAVLKHFCERCNEEMSEEPCEPSDCFARQVIKEAPAADVAPVVHGRWMARSRKNGVGKVCSACVTAFTFAPTNYCPHCGARMDGDG